MTEAQVGIPIPERFDRAEFVDKIKPENVVEIMRHKIMGEEYIDGGWVKIPGLQHNALSEQGAWDLSNLMLGVGTINMSISKLNSNQINERLKNLIGETMRLLLSNWKRYGITNLGQFYYVKSLMYSNALAVLSQADEGSIQDLLKTTINENRLISSDKKEPGRLSRLMGMKQ